MGTSKAIARQNVGMARQVWNKGVYWVARPWTSVALTACVVYALTSLPTDGARDGGVSGVGRMLERSVVFLVERASGLSGVGKGGRGGKVVVYGGPQNIAMFVARRSAVEATEGGKAVLQAIGEDIGSSTGVAGSNRQGVAEQNADAMRDIRAQFIIIDPDVVSMDLATQLLSQRPMDIGTVSVLLTPLKQGMLWPTRADHGLFVRSPTTWSREEQLAARGSFARYLQRMPGKALPVVGRKIEEGMDTRIMWSGYALNCVTLIVIGAWCISITWVLPGSAWRVRRARAKGVCASCGYSLVGLESARMAGNKHDNATATCPECGRKNNA